MKTLCTVTALLSLAVAMKSRFDGDDSDALLFMLNAIFWLVFALLNEEP